MRHTANARKASLLVEAADPSLHDVVRGLEFDILFGN